jgi:hypothetical protein
MAEAIPQQANIFPTPALGAQPVQDGRLLHFLKEFPPWAILVLVLSGLLACQFIREFDFLPRLIDQAFGGLLATLVQGLRRGATTTTNNTVQADTVETDQVKTESMDDATINVGEAGPDDPNNPNPKDEKGDI